MRRGDFSEAWALSDAMLGAPQDHRHTPRHLQRIWSGASLRNQRVLVRCYHGLGDTLQFIRYAPFIKQTARDVTVWAQSSLLSILRSVSGIDRLLPLHDGAVNVDYDVDVEVMELPHVFRTTIATVPASVPYVDPPVAIVPSARRTEDLRVGFVWRSGTWDAARSMSLAEMTKLFDVPGTHVVPLHSALSEGDALCFDSLPDVATIDTLAATIRSLDLVITVDTMAAHLAGALAVPTWLLLHDDPDWRWMNDRVDTPWYPHTTLYRQHTAGEWAPVLDRVRRDLMQAARHGIERRG